MSNDYMIRKGNDPVLKAICTPIEPGEPLPWLDRMEQACRRARGIGLAAPQIGVAKRVIFTVQSNGMGGLGTFFINPVITWRSDETDVRAEGCLSFPGITKRIRRATKIRVAYESRTRQPCEVEFCGFPARVIQHEVDHLDGICRVGDPLFNGEPEPRHERERFKRRMPVSALVAMAALASLGSDRR